MMGEEMLVGLIGRVGVMDGARTVVSAGIAVGTASTGGWQAVNSAISTKMMKYFFISLTVFHDSSVW